MANSKVSNLQESETLKNDDLMLLCSKNDNDDEYTSKKVKISTLKNEINSDITDLLNQKADKTSVYTKSETYTKTEVNNLINQGTISKAIFDAIYPVGSIYISIGSTLPENFQGNWTKISDGKSIWTTSNSSELGHAISPELPNITGTTNTGTSYTGDYDITGAFSKLKTVYNAESGAKDEQNVVVKFDASNSCNIYKNGNNSIVRPNSIGVSMWKRVEDTPEDTPEV